MRLPKLYTAAATLATVATALATVATDIIFDEGVGADPRLRPEDHHAGEDDL